MLGIMKHCKVTVGSATNPQEPTHFLYSGTTKLTGMFPISCLRICANKQDVKFTGSMSAEFTARSTTDNSNCKSGCYFLQQWLTFVHSWRPCYSAELM